MAFALEAKAQWRQPPAPHSAVEVPELVPDLLPIALPGSLLDQFQPGEARHLARRGLQRGRRYNDPT